MLSAVGIIAEMNILDPPGRQEFFHIFQEVLFACPQVGRVEGEIEIVRLRESDEGVRPGEEVGPHFDGAMCDRHVLDGDGEKTVSKGFLEIPDALQAAEESDFEVQPSRGVESHERDFEPVRQFDGLQEGFEEIAPTLKLVKGRVETSDVTFFQGSLDLFLAAAPLESISEDQLDAVEPHAMGYFRGNPGRFLKKGTR